VTLLALALALWGCGSDDEPSTTTNASPPPRADSQRDSRVGDGVGGVRLAKIGDFEAPLYVAQPPGERSDLFVVEQGGRIMVLPGGTTPAEPFLDISDRISSGGERGLLSVAFAPDYRSSGRLYVDFTDPSGDTRIEEYTRSTDNPLRADPSSRREVLGFDQPYANHNGGLLLFGPDRLLYVGSGDGGSEGDPERNGQSLTTLLGKILRIDPRPGGGRPYGIPASNPFVDRGGARGEIYSYGLRNPWRFSFDRKTDALSIGDVGQDQFEEIDLVGEGKGRGANFGWSAFEGEDRSNEDQTASGAIPPVLTYTHAGGNCSVTGGYVVRDPSLESLYGRYLYGDLCVGELHSFPARPDRSATDDRALGVDIPQLSSFGEDNDGWIYAASLDGPVYRLAPSDRR
jgi:glucose/arabinose dehydrogenase